MTKRPDIVGRIHSLIQERGIKPKPGWVFSMKEVILWFLFALSIGFGGMAAALTIFMSAREEWDVYLRAAQNFGTFLVLSIPIAWLLCLLLFGWFAASSLQKTKRGYRWSAMSLVGISIVGSILVGAALHGVGWSRSFDTLLSGRLRYYDYLRGARNLMWTQPEEGMLAGNVVRYVAPRTFLLLDLEGDLWEVDASMTRTPLPPEGIRIRALGAITASGTFVAQDIRPWMVDGPDMWGPPPF